MPNVQQICNGKGRGHPTSCICGRRETAAVQPQHILNLGARRGRCSALISGRFVPPKELVYFLQEAGWTGMDKSPTQEGFNPRPIKSSQYICIIIKRNAIYTSSNTTNLYIYNLIAATSFGLGRPSSGQNIYKNLSSGIYSALFVNKTK